MSSVDDRVVQIKFDNAAFESAIKTTLASLDKLKKSTDTQYSSKGLNDLSAAVSRFSMGNIKTQIEGVNAKFLALATIGVTALSNIASQAVATGTAFVKSLTVDPIISGLREYETNLNSIQTILANTEASGATLKDVGSALDELNEYSDKTIYNFSEMARNIGTFTAAGVALEPATDAIKGIANLAALSGSNSMQASTAMYQLSQAISAGKVSLQDWNSVVNAGMGGTVFQRALANTAVAMGTLDKNAVKLSGSMKNVTINGQSFRQALSAEGKGGKSWLTSEVLTKTLAQFTGDLTDAELAAQGFTKAQIKAIQQQAKTAQEAATKVKTLTQTIDVAKETAQSGWSQTWRYIFGDFEEARGSFTELSDSLNGFLNSQADARNAILKEWKFWGGRDAAIDAVRNAFAALGSVLKPIKDAFREIFPRKTGKELADLTKSVRDFFGNLKLNEGAAENLKKTFAGFFAVLKIGVSLFKAIFGVAKTLLAPILGLGGGLLSATGSVGDFLVNLQKTVEEGQVFEKFFARVGEALQPVVGFLNTIGEAISSLFAPKVASSIGSTGDAVEDTGEKFAFFTDIIERLKDFWETLVSGFQSAKPTFGSIGETIGNAISSVAEFISNGFENIDWDTVIKGLQVGLLGGVLLVIRKFLKDGLGILFNFGDLGDSIRGTFDALTDTLKAMQTQIKAKALLAIAGAVAILAAAVYVISTIDSEELSKSLIAITVMFVQLGAMLKFLDKVTTGGTKLIAIGVGLILLSVSLLIMASAVKSLASVDGDKLAQGLAAIGVLLLFISRAIEPLSDNTHDLAKAGFGIILIAVGLNILAYAVEKFGEMDLVTMAKGLLGVTAALTGMVFALSKTPKEAQLVKMGVALILVAIALNVMAGAIERVGKIDLSEIVKAILAFSAILLVLALALRTMPQDGKAQLGLLLVSFALKQIADVISQFGTASLKEIIQGIIVLGVVLAILVTAMKGMDATKNGIIALIAMTGALILISKVLQELGALPIEQILTGLLAIAGIFLIMGAAAAILSPVIGVVLLLAGAVLMLGAGLALMGVGALAFATALKIIMEVASLGVDVINKMIDTFLSVLPRMLIALQAILVGVAGVIATSAPAFIGAFVAILIAMIQAANQVIPELEKLVNTLLGSLINIISTNFPKLVDLGVQLIENILTGIRDHVQNMIDIGGEIIIAFIVGIGQKAAEIAVAAGETLIKFIDALRAAVDTYAPQIERSVDYLVQAIFNALKTLVGNKISDIGQLGANIGSAILDGAKSFLGIASPSKEFIKVGKYIVQGLVKGIVGGEDEVRNSLAYIRQELKDLVKQTKDDVKKANDNLKKLKEDGASEEKIKKAEDELKKAEAAAKRAANAFKKFNVTYKKQRQRLRELGREYDQVSAKLDAAKNALEEAKDKRDSFSASTKDQFDDLPDIEDLKALREEIVRLTEARADAKEIAEAQKKYDEAKSLDNYFDAIRKSTSENKTFLATLQRLRDLGLSDLNYENFITEGVTALPFLQDLLNAGPETIAELNKISKGLDDSASGIGSTTSKELYQAGVDAAQGLVNGLKTQLKTIETEMERLGGIMARGLKKALGIKSPSRVFAAIGKQSTDGLAKGLSDGAKVIDITSKRIGRNASDALREAMAKVGENLDPEMDLNMDITPTVAPVLNLDEFRKKAKDISDILDAGEVSKKAYIATRGLTFDRADPSAVPPAQTNINFTQNNNSPKALSSSEIYRQTKNQISALKGAASNAN
jgi:tape measure domain-containing protein